MENRADDKSLLNDPKRLLLDMAQEYSGAELLQLIVTRLSRLPRIALARIWLAQPTADCTCCPMVEVCRVQSRCLHLAASCGRSVVEPSIEWTGLDGEFRRVPIGVLKVGRIAASGEPMEEPDLCEPFPEWVAHPDWVRAEGIRGFAGQPLSRSGEMVGVLALFARQPISGDCMGWLRMIADHAACAITTTGAFAEIVALRKRLELENEYLREEVSGAGAFGDLIGRSSALQTVARQIELVASTDSTILILGESGTGKELVAREIHRRSRRADKPLIKVNCAAIPRDLYETEFFGHVRGAFTGAVRERVGRFELAHNGTLLLDEIGEIPLELQAKLLRVLQEGELERIGEDRTRRVDVRVIAVTNRDLRAEAEAGHFRQDLYYRLSVFPLEVPPLRKRKEDIPLLADHFLQVSARKAGRPKLPLTMASVQQLQQYHWPGNVRELHHVIERAVIISTGSRLSIELPSAGSSHLLEVPASSADAVWTDAQIRQFEAENIRAALKAAMGQVAGPGGAAQRLGLKPTTLASRMRALGIRPSGPATKG
jgi:transcriptional regulator with GAF, ATPase, and Fis domain